MKRRAPNQKSFWLRIRLLLLSAVLIVFVVWGPLHHGWFSDHLPFLPITEITINEPNWVNRQWLQDQTQSYQGSNLLTLPLEEVASRLKVNPWVQSVGIRRHWPNRVSIFVETYKPAAQWNQTGYITFEKHLVAVPPLAQLNDLPLLEGPANQQELVWQTYQTFSEISSKVKLPITRLVLTPWGSCRVTFAKKIEVVLGKIDTQARLERFIMAYSALEDLRTVQNNVYVDLRYNDGLTIAWRNN